MAQVLEKREFHLLEHCALSAKCGRFRSREEGNSLVRGFLG